MTSTISRNQSAKPLSDLRILVTRASQQSDSFVESLSSKGARAFSVPSLVIAAPSDWRYLDDELNRLHRYDWLILTSANGVNFFIRRLLDSGYSLTELSAIKIAVVGKKTALQLKSHGIQIDFIPPDFISESLVEYFPERDCMEDVKILYPCLEEDRRELLISELSALGAVVVDVPAYCSRCPERLSEGAIEALKEGIDVVTLASPKTARYFHQLVEQSQDILQARPDELLANTAIASIGPLTSKTCHSVFGRVDIQPQEYSLNGLEASIVQWAASR